MNDKVHYVAKKTGGIIFENNKDKDDGSQWTNAIDNLKQWIIDNVNKGDTVEYELTGAGHISKIEVKEKSKQLFQSGSSYSGRMSPQEKDSMHRTSALYLMAHFKISPSQTNMDNFIPYFVKVISEGDTSYCPIEEEA